MRADTILLLFDIDGTLLACEGRGLRAMHRAVQRVCRRGPATVQIRAGGKTDPALFEEMAGAYGIHPAELEIHGAALRETYAEEFAGELRLTGHCAIKPGVGVLLERLAARREIRLGLVTGNLERTARLKLDSVRISGYFPNGGFGSDGRHRADLVGLAVERCAAGLPRHPRRIWVIGDTPADVESGRSHGACTLAVATGAASRVELEAAGADAIFDDFTDTERVVDLLCEVG